MKKIKTAYGYDIYKLTEKECREHWYEYPCFAVFVEGETYETVGLDESTFGTLEEAKAWCEQYDRTYY